MEKLLITGAAGLVGSAVRNAAGNAGYDVIPLVGRRACDLTVPSDVFALFRYIKPDFVCHLAADVFGVGGNLKFPGQVFYNNTLMNTVVIEASRTVGVKKLVAMGSAAMYSDDVELPMKESDAMLSLPHSSEYGYAFSKRAMLAQLECYRSQYGLDFGFVIATNMYGPHDKFDTQYGHVVPSLIRKFFDAQRSGAVVSIWGDGSPTRDFVYSLDAAAGILRILDSGSGAYNLATGKSCSIRRLVEIISAHFPGVDYHWDIEKPLGQLARSYDVGRIASIGFSPSYSLESGISETVAWVRDNLNIIRG